MIRHCRFNNQHKSQICDDFQDPQKVTTVITPKHGVCYSFNALDKSKAGESLKVFSSGPDFGLNLILDIGALVYMRYALSQSEGVHVVITQPGDMPEVLASQIDVGK